MLFWKKNKRKQIQNELKPTPNSVTTYSNTDSSDICQNCGGPSHSEPSHYSGSPGSIDECPGR